LKFKSERVFRENKSSTLTRFIPYIRNLLNRMCFECFENTKFGIFCLSQGLFSNYYFKDPQGVNFINILAWLFHSNRMRSFFQCTNWTDGKQRLANGALIWRISAYILCEFHWCCSKQNVDGIEWANFGWKLLCVSQFFAWRKKFGEIDPRCFFKCINIVITLSDFRCFLNVSI